MRTLPSVCHYSILFFSLLNHKIAPFLKSSKASPHQDNYSDHRREGGPGINPSSPWLASAGGSRGISWDEREWTWWNNKWESVVCFYLSSLSSSVDLFYLRKTQKRNEGWIGKTSVEQVETFLEMGTQLGGGHPCFFFFCVNKWKNGNIHNK